MSELIENIDRLREAVVELEALLEDVSEDQWTKSRLTGGSGAQHSDTTGDTAVDPRRLDLREQIVRANAVLTLARGHVTAARRRVADAHERWSGDRLDT